MRLATDPPGTRSAASDIASLSMIRLTAVAPSRLANSPSAKFLNHTPG